MLDVLMYIFQKFTLLLKRRNKRDRLNEMKIGLDNRYLFKNLIILII